MLNKWIRNLIILTFGSAVICSAFGVAAESEKTLMMATTTSTENTGLLDYLIPEFKKATGIELKRTATGTGKALKLGQNCDIDVLMVHSPLEEKKFIENGFGTNRREFMYNDFVLIGPQNDPAGIKGKTIKGALNSIKLNKAVFVSRGDNSGTHQMELSLWKAADLAIPDKEEWYVQTGQGMLASMAMADERKGYTLSDRGTYIKYENNLRGNPALRILVERDASLLNQYSVIAVNKVNCPNVKYDLAMQFIDWITGPEAQALIRDFKLMGKPLFTPNAK